METIATDNPFSESEQVFLRRLAGLIIPAEENLKVPGAEDEDIFAEFLQSARPSAAVIKEGITNIRHVLDDESDQNVSNNGSENCGGKFRRIMPMI